MATVDLAFDAVAREAGIETATYWRLWDQSELIADPSGSYATAADTWHDPSTGLDYRKLRGNLDEALAADVVVYWGDFLHMAPYQAEAARILRDELACPSGRADAERVVLDHLMLASQGHEVLERTASFGTTLSLNSPADYAGAYGEHLRRFLSRLGTVAMRDGYSAQVVREARGDWTGSYMVPDLALLRVGDDAPGVTREGLGVFFARSRLPPEALARLGSGLARATGMEPSWIDWGREPAFWPMRARKRFRLAWPALEHGQLRAGVKERARTLRAVAGKRDLEIASVQPTLPALLGAVASYRAIITDTYHLAVNAWRSGVPAVCVLDAPGRQWSVNSGAPGSARDKRWDLYSSLDALEYSTVGTWEARRTQREVARLAELLSDRPAADAVREHVARRARLGRAMVAGSLRRIAVS